MSAEEERLGRRTQHRVCPGCGRVIALLRTGRMYQHIDRDGNLCAEWEREHRAWLAIDESSWEAFRSTP